MNTDLTIPRTLEDAKQKRDELVKSLEDTVEYFIRHNPDLIIHDIEFETTKYEAYCGEVVEPRFKVTILI